MIGIFNDNFPPVFDGVGLTAKNYADWLCKKDKDVCVVTPYAPGLPITPYRIYTYHSVPLLMRKPYRIGLPFTDYVFRKHLSKVSFDIVHAHCPFTSGLWALKVARNQNIPIVATFHSKYRQDLERSIRSKFIVDKAIRQIVQFYEQADEVWIPQASVEPTLREYGYKGEVTVVENGNDLNTSDEDYIVIREQTRNRLGINPKECILLYVGQHTWEKNIGLTIDALSHISDKPFRFYMIGTGYATEAISKKIHELGLNEKIRMLGVISSREMLKSYYAAADLFMFPSAYDTDGLVMHEAAAMRTPSIMLEGSSAAKSITDGYNGFLTLNDPIAYAQLISHLMNNRDEIYRAGQNASTTLTRSWESVVEEVIQRYDDICRRYKK